MLPTHVHVLIDAHMAHFQLVSFLVGFVSSWAQCELHSLPRTFAEFEMTSGNTTPG